MKKFFAVIGNPPYQEESEKNGRQPPIYNFFMNDAFKIAEYVEVITPARFLFNAGQTPKEWNKERLEDEHFKVLSYQSDASKVFPNTDIKGGVAVTLRSESNTYGKIGVFTEFAELNSIINKVWKDKSKESLSSICIGAVPYHYTKLFAKQCPKWVDLAGDSFDLRTNALDKLAGKIFFEEKGEKGDWVKVYGLYNKKRNALWIEERYIEGPGNFAKYKILVSKANGSGKFGETLSDMICAEPYSGHTQSFISVGAFNLLKEAKNAERYIKTKFVRCLLSILRTTPDTTPYKWKYVPLQDFTSKSDIDWTKSVHEIDLQLYKKYGLSKEEKDFIETHVKEMV
jgi:type II restriction enzyme